MSTTVHAISPLDGVTVMAVHAHPDDEAIWTGGLLAHLARRGANVIVVTCTLGEQGEVIGEPYQNLVADHADQLGGFRIRELSASLAALGVRGVHLGAVGQWRDSGMAGDPSADHPRAFVNNLDQATEQLRALIDEHRPDLLVTYGPDGGYGHPDHIAAHTITHRAAPADTRILWAVTLEEDLEAGFAGIHSIPDTWRRADAEIARVATADLRLTLSQEELACKVAAMKAHATQLWIADGHTSATNPIAAYAQAETPVFALSNLIAQPITASEAYQIGAGPQLPAGAKDLLDGLGCAEEGGVVASISAQHEREKE
ncbi:1D-myo-inositol 2-acetamido-2-deoxy-alpha-D-glucopyranoside deacetylase [Corynebacterium ciconiae DSM 44920]|uniref:N-acetyl-1-D-myo-inositol-2-amino-2-deoxy-alpha- D-glucopyranoside deacetylase n=1 Tax=Corynebacterium ciconiae TaxID=227319 RepID=UPI0003699048|nr:N-acetyl-1-D-myo-inositol-2-amino-2-deoxy-alpha-D-glucopyranoside deacetylase [Corynebacterium ciconiae]WKD60857.1 1D-myo-inositol 2-acetamido-2-deoxy-alpha-D-glucopyranoside deacetylase [Corynebacterium ciconiae DSM 44920]